MVRNHVFWVEYLCNRGVGSDSGIDGPYLETKFRVCGGGGVYYTK